MRSIIAISGLAAVAAGPPSNCTTDDYSKLFDMNIESAALCLNDNDGSWDSCLSIANMSTNCQTDMLALFDSNSNTTCGDLCTNVTSSGCRICLGVVAMQQADVLAPEVPWGVCGNSADRDAIASVNLSAIIEADSVTSIGIIGNFSNNCANCFAEAAWFTANPDYCGVPCETSGNSLCYDCEAVMFFEAISYCNVLLPPVSCVDSDYAGLARMNPGTVMTCLETSQADDAFVACFGELNTANLTSDCSVGLEAVINAHMADVCDTDVCADESVTVDCLNCRGAVFVKTTMDNLPSISGVCNETEISAMDTLDLSVVLSCATEPYSAANCFASGAEVSDACSMCIESRTTRAVHQCAAHCTDSTSADCLTCVNIGLMGATAHCTFSSGAAGPVASVFSVAALLAFVLIA